MLSSIPFNFWSYLSSLVFWILFLNSVTPTRVHGLRVETRRYSIVGPSNFASLVVVFVQLSLSLWSIRDFQEEVVMMSLIRLEIMVLLVRRWKIIMSPTSVAGLTFSIVKSTGRTVECVLDWSQNVMWVCFWRSAKVSFLYIF